MHNLDSLYKPGFFKNRHKLAWRAPIICNSIIEKFSPKNTIDIGAAVGDLVAYFVEKGIDAYGIEGSRSAESFLMCDFDRIHFFDLRFQISCLGRYDLVTCFEVAEHIEPEYADTFFQNLILSNRILMSAAPPGQKGHGHFNCQEYDFWIGMAESYGYKRDVSVEDYFKQKWEPWKKKDGIRAYYHNLLYFESV